MKVLLAVLALVVCVYAAEWTPKTPAEVHEIGVQCKKEYPLSDELADKAKNFIFPDEESVRKHLLCYSLKMGIFSEDHGFYPDRVVKELKVDNDPAMLAIAQDCAAHNPKVVDEPTDVWFFKGHKCILSSKLGDHIKTEINKSKEIA